jgi:hypothetical protein
VLDHEQIRDLSAFGGNCLRADLRRLALGNTVEDFREFVVCVLADFLRALGVIVVEGLGGAERFDKIEVTRAAGCDDFTA